MNTDKRYCIGSRCLLTKSCGRYLPLYGSLAVGRLTPAFDGVECPNYTAGVDEYFDRIAHDLCPECVASLRREGGCLVCHDCGWSACGA